MTSDDIPSENHVFKSTLHVVQFESLRGFTMFLRSGCEYE